MRCPVSLNRNSTTRNEIWPKPNLMIINHRFDVIYLMINQIKSNCWTILPTSLPRLGAIAIAIAIGGTSIDIAIDQDHETRLVLERAFLARVYPRHRLMKLLVGTASSQFHELVFSSDSQKLSIVTSTSSPEPGWLHHYQNSIFAVSESDHGRISKFDREGSGWSRQWCTDTSGDGTAHCSVAVAGGTSFVLVANYGGHTVDVVDMSGRHLQRIEYDGSGPFEGRQESSHCHQIIQDLRKKFVFVNDLGGDRLHRYILGSDGKLTESGVIKFKPGQGPRHCTFNIHHPDLIYEICELSNELLIFRWAEKGDAELLQTVSVLPDSEMEGKKHPEYPQPASAGEIQITADGKFLYASTRYLPKHRSDTILFAPINDRGLLGDLKHLDTGLIAPWHFSLSPDEAWLAAAFKDSSVVKLYRRNAKTGELSQCASLESGLEAPSCVIFL